MMRGEKNAAAFAPCGLNSMLSWLISVFSAAPEAMLFRCDGISMFRDGRTADVHLNAYIEQYRQIIAAHEERWGILLALAVHGSRVSNHLYYTLLYMNIWWPAEEYSESLSCSSNHDWAPVCARIIATFGVHLLCAVACSATDKMINLINFSSRLAPPVYANLCEKTALHHQPDMMH